MSQSHTGSTHLLHRIYGKPGREPSAEEGLPGCCSDDAQVSLRCSRHPADGQAARQQAGRVCSCTRTGSGTTSTIPGSTAAVRKATWCSCRPWRGRQYRAVNIGARSCPRLPTPFDGDIAIAGSCDSPAYAPSYQTMRHRISVEGRFVNVVMTWARCSAVSVTANKEECASRPGFVAQVALRRVVWGARRSPNLCWCPASRLPIAGTSTRTCWLRAAWLISCWGPFPLHTSTSSK